MKVGIVGVGMVGGAMWSIFPDAILYDAPKGMGRLENMAQCQVVFLCLPTPTVDGKIVTEVVDDTLKRLSSILTQQTLVVIRSSVLPGYTEKAQRDFLDLRLAYNPEFLREEYAEVDAKHPKRLVIGTHSEADFQEVRQSYIESRIYKGEPVIYLKTTPTEAEFIKYASNTFLATKVSFANEMWDIAQKIGVDWERAQEALSLDPRIGPYLGVSKDRGFSGSCLPKDIQAFIAFGKDLGMPVTLLEEVWQVNKRVRRE